MNKTTSKLIVNGYSIKKYNSDSYKITLNKMPFKPRGFELERKYNYSRDVNEYKLSNNVIRAKMKVFEYAMCNDFDYFVTLTLDKDKYQRDDLNKYIKDLGQFIRDYRKKYQVDIQYLLIPEKHEDKVSWHMHGLIKGIPIEHLRKFTLNEILPYRLRELIAAGRDIYDWTKYQEKFGWVTIERVMCQERISKYITKYIKKSLDNDRGVTEKNKKLYYSSRGLKQAQKVKKGTLTSWQLEQIPFDFENDYVKSKMLNSLEYLKLDNQILNSTK